MNGSTTYLRIEFSERIQKETADLSFEPAFYNMPQLISQKHRGRLVTFHLYAVYNAAPQASISLGESGGKHWVSLPGLPFGGLQCASNISAKALVLFMEKIEDWIRAQGGTSITINIPSSIYPNYPVDYSKPWKYMDYKVVKQPQNLHILVDNHAFIDQLHSSERRRLIKCQNAGFRSMMVPVSDAGPCYDWLAQQWALKQYSPSVSRSVFYQMLHHHREHYIIYEITDKEKRIALGVAVKAHSTVLYTFFLADLASYRNHSPMVMLYASMYEYAQKAGIKYLDMGTSLDRHGNFKKSLAQFKTRLGGHTTFKTEWSKLLAPKIS